MRARFTFLAFVASLQLFAGVVRVEVAERSEISNGVEFGATGPYERIVGKVFFSIDPDLPANRIISDIGYAPRNPSGRVEFSADLYVFKPKDPARGNGTALFEVSNRGRKGLLSQFSLAPGTNNPRALEDFGDGLLFQQGYTLVWLGWQFDVPQQPDLLRFHAPVARDKDGPFTGLVRAEHIPLSAGQNSFSLADRQHIPYPATDPDDFSLKLTVRSAVTGPRRTIPREHWQFARLENGALVPDTSTVYVAKGLEAGKIYELVYTARNPVLVGLGPAAIRDFIAFLKYPGTGAQNQPLGDQHQYVKRAIAYGSSQSGRFLRNFVYQGFNASEEGRKVFDGMMVHVAGGGRGSFNHRFAQPSRDGHPFLNTLYPTDLFPFSDLPQTDPLTGDSGGLLDHARKTDTEPRIFYTNSSYEYWGRSAALTHISVDGKKDFEVPATSRIYLLAGSQHGAGSFPPRPQASAGNLPNVNDYRFAMRGLLEALNAWIAMGKEPPPSQYPRIADGTLFPFDNWRFSKLPGITLPQRPQRAYRADYGPDFRTGGVITKEPPEAGTPFPILVPKTDADGNELAGIHLPEIAVPLATYTGWNMRTVRTGAPLELLEMVGSFFPFPKDANEQRKAKDPRKPISARYAGKEDFLNRIRLSAKKLAEQGYILPGDLSRMERRALEMWDWSAGR